MKILKRYKIFFLIIMMAITGCQQGSKKIPSLKETYRSADKNPFGSFVAFQRLSDIFPAYKIMKNNAPIDETWYYEHNHSSRENYTLYFLVTKNLLLNYVEASTLIDFVKEGNDLFISADFIDPTFLESIFTSVNRQGEISAETKGKMRDTHVSMFFGDQIKSELYGFYYFPYLNYIESYEDNFTRILGVNEKNQPNYALFFVGTGRVYLHVAPRAFSNYFLLTGDNYQYFENVISYLRLDPGKIYWDEYYKNSTINRVEEKKRQQFSSLKVIHNNPPLLWAFWLAIIGMILFVLFKLKRKQRIIEEIKPNINATVTFTETIGRLYFQHKDNRRIADKMISFLFENIRHKYFINTIGINEEFINSLSGKSGAPVKNVKELITLIRKIQSQETITDEELMELNIKIDQFNKNKH